MAREAALGWFGLARLRGTAVPGPLSLLELGLQPIECSSTKLSGIHQRLIVSELHANSNLGDVPRWLEPLAITDDVFGFLMNEMRRRANEHEL